MSILKCYPVTFLLVLLMTEIGQAQTFISYDKFMNSGYESRKSGADFNYDRVKSFLNDLHPKLYILNGTVKDLTQGNLYYAEVDTRSLSQLLNIENTGSLEMLTLKVSDKDAVKVDTSPLEKFKSLKYIYVICDYKCDLEYIKGLFLSTRNDYLVIYANSTPN